MDLVLYVLGLIALMLACTVGVAILVFGLPGTFVILGAGLVYAWSTGFAAVTATTLVWLAVLALFAEGLEMASAALAAGPEKPSRRVTVGAIAGGIAGGIIGTPFFFGVGSLLGALAGAFTGAALAVTSEGGGAGHALRHGLAALRGRLLGFIVKTAIAVVMVIVLLAAAI